MDMKVSKRDAALLLGILGVLAVALVYYFVFMSYKEKTEVLRIENETLEKRVNVLQGLANKREKMEESTQANREATRDLLERFPADVREEDVIMMAVTIQGQSPYESISSVGIGLPEEVIDATDIEDRVESTMEGRLGAELASAEGQENEESEPVQADVDEEILEGVGLVLDGGYVLKKREVQITGTATYEGFKESVKMLAERKDRTRLSVMASYDIETGLVDAQLSLGTYYMTGTGKLYQPPNIPFISQGTGNIFGTVELRGNSGGTQQYEQTEEEAEEEAEEAGEA